MLIVLLGLGPDRILDDSNAPRLPQVGSFEENDRFEVLRESIVRHNIGS
jgi:hypothetical protein